MSGTEKAAGQPQAAPAAASVETWFAEPPFGGYQQRYQQRAKLHEQSSQWQHAQVLDLEPTGLTLILDGTLQTSLGEEFTYHEPLVHVAMFAHPRPKRVLIVGGGDGGALRHVLLHSSVERAVEAEIDRLVVDLSLKYLPEISGGAYDDPRAELIVDDGARFMRETHERFDVVIVDSTDPVGPAAALVGDEFLAAARRALAPGGIMVMQSGSPLTQPREFVLTQSAFRRAFPLVKPFLSFVPIYPGILWSWATGSVDRDPAALDLAATQQRVAALPEELRIYNPEWHRAAFAVPTFVRKLAQHDQPPTESDLRAFGHPLPRVVAA